MAVTDTRALKPRELQRRGTPRTAIRSRAGPPVVPPPPPVPLGPPPVALLYTSEPNGFSPSVAAKARCGRPKMSSTLLSIE